MRHLKVHWIHDLTDEPEWIYSELDDDRWEVRKVEVFPDGSTGYASATEEGGPTRLADEHPYPPDEEIAADEFGEFEVEGIDRRAFEDVWAGRLDRVRR